MGCADEMGCTSEMGCASEMGRINEMDYTDGIGCVGKMGYRVSEVKVGVSMVVYKIGFLIILVLVLALAKLFLKR